LKAENRRAILFHASCGNVNPSKKPEKNPIFNVMKIPAFILLVALSTYLTETIRVPIQFSEITEKARCCSRSEVPCKMDHGKNKSNKSCPTKCEGVNCLNCPMCYNLVTPAALTASSPYFNLKIQYFVQKEKLRSDYFNKAWKPPDPA
jgi:hypothetical protein